MPKPLSFNAKIDAQQTVQQLIDGAKLRTRLTQLYEDSNGNVSDLRRQAVVLLRAELDQAREALLSNPNPQLSGLGLARALSGLADQIIGALWDFTLIHVYRASNPTQGERLSLVAVGGYGRGELAPFSDLDLLFLRLYKESSHSESVIEFMLYCLWDMGIKVGYASRTVDETIKYCKSDHTILTSVLEFRPLAGDDALAQALRERLKSDILRHQATDFIASKLNERDVRHAKGGDVRFVVEPNVKEGKGGLRDLQSLFWIARFLSKSGPDADKSGHDQGPINDTNLTIAMLDRLLTEKERQSFALAFDFLWAVRHLLHRISGRAEERLSFDLQPEIARRLGFIDRHGEPAVERFMRRYFTVAKEVGALTRIFCTKLEAMRTKPLTRLSQMIQSGLMSLAHSDFPQFCINEGRLSLTHPDVFTGRPDLMFALFKMADKLDLDLHPDAFTGVSRNLSLVTTSVRRDPRAARLFLDILVYGKSPYRTLSLMTETGLLGRYIPEFGHIVAQTQFNMYHAYTVDEHTLRAIATIHDIDTGQHREDHPLASSLMPQLAEKETLYLAMLMHDTGKGHEAGQEIGGEMAARKACQRLGLAQWQIDQVAWLVRHHLVLSDFAQKRDVSDPETIAAFARIVETPERLRLLLILTVADIRAVGPNVWNGWKGQLMRDLWASTEAFFRGGQGADAMEHMQAEIKQSADLVRQNLSEKAPLLREWLLSLEDHHLLAFSQEDLRKQGALALEARLAGAACDTQIDLHRNATAFIVAAKDRKALFCDLATALAHLGGNVVGARVFTSNDAQALDIFYVQDAQGKPYGHAHKALLETACSKLIQIALVGQHEPVAFNTVIPARQKAFAIAPTVTFDDISKAEVTIVEVSGRDRTGLLADLTRAMMRSSVNICSAHIDCYGERAVDAFYVTCDHGQLDDAQKAELKSHLLMALEPEPLKPNDGKKALLSARSSLAR